jgi:hypothetical protein
MEKQPRASAQCMNIAGRFLRAAVAVAIMLPLMAIAQQAPPAPPDPATLPARDQHENLLVAVRLCADKTCASERFGKQNPVDAGILPVEVFLRNDSDQPLRLGLEDIRLDISPPEGRHQELVALSADEVAGHIVYPAGAAAPENPGSRPHVGFGLPKRDKKSAQVAEKIQPFVLDTDLVGPHSMAHGFLFFDLNKEFNLIPDCSLYIPNIRTLNGDHHLTYFEVSLKAAQQP